MKLVETGSRIMSLILKKAVKDFAMMREDWGEPEKWRGNLRCEWPETKVTAEKFEGEWLIKIDGRHLYWCHPADPANPGNAVADIASLLNRFAQAADTARRFLGP
jgi:hypothetical protein